MDDAPTPSFTKTLYRAIFVSPHLDDAVFSCGGEIARLSSQGPVLVINIFTRYLSDVKIRGVVLNESRYEEEADAAKLLGFESRNLGELDVTFRRNPYQKLGNIFRPPVEEDLQWLPELRQKLFGILSELDFQQIYVPLGVGWHVDHILTHHVFDTWAETGKLLYYEDTPYCCIPHATRFRLNDIAIYPQLPGDSSLVPIPNVKAWWQTSMGYANTALMRNLKPWIVRKSALPVVSYYLWRLMSTHRRKAATAPKRLLHPCVIPIDDYLQQKVDAMLLYNSQFKEFFSSRQDGVNTLSAYAKTISHSKTALERYWTPTPIH
ncbi:PIG-L deacetylase family protein [Rhodoferax sp. BLA1]|uniref:PIG-L deacetylase family protein n=1 Tax=Rhodoferax sp. BLA1 TaxID=2576062 RepID=UPI0015D0D727|nr:PIG-L family deacetylase [Rhodoferax sp. BLA1]